jgi:purine nucleoside phosphorylase
MSEPYDLSRIDRHGAIRTGVYAALSAPPTGAEQRFLRAAGADIYGPGVAPDVLVAVHCGLPVMALGGVVSACSPDDPDGFFLTEAETGTLDAGLIEIAKRMVSVHTVH